MASGPPASGKPRRPSGTAAAQRAAGLSRPPSSAGARGTALGASLDGADGGGLGADLELDTGGPSSGASPPAGAVAAPPGPAGPAGFGDDEEDDWEEHAALDVALDMGSVRPPPIGSGAAAPAEPGAAPPPSSAKPVVAGAAAPPDGAAGAPVRARPLKAAPAATPSDLLGHPDELAVRQLAAYGLVPENILATLPYAWRVLRRRQELRALHREQQQTHGEICRGLREQMAGLVDEATAGAVDQPEVKSLLAPIAQCDQLIDQRSKTLEAATGQYSGQVVAIDKELAGIEATRKQASRDRSMVQIKLEDAMQKRSTAQATLKRMDERIQAALDAASAAAGKGADFAPPEHARRIAALKAERASLQQQVEGCEAAVVQVQGALREADRAVRDEDRKVAAAKERRQAVEREANQAKDVGFKGLREAQERRLDAYQNVLAALTASHPELLGEELTRRVNDVTDGLARADEELERHRLAIDAYDKSSFQRGLLIAGAIGVVLLLLLITMARVSGPARTGPAGGLMNPDGPVETPVGTLVGSLEATERRPDAPSESPA